MSAVVKAVKTVAKAAFKVVETVGKVVVKTAERIGKVVENTVNAVGKAVESIAKIAKPLLENYAIQLALMAAGIPPVYAAPMSAGMGTLARGGSVEDALKSAATVAVVQQAGEKVATAMNDANKAAIAAGGKAVYSNAEIAAAVSATTSAVSTAAAGGDLQDVLKGAGIGAIAGTAGTKAFMETKSLAVANFVRTSVTATLQGVELKQAVLMGASEATVTFLKQVQEEQKRGDDLLTKRDKAYDNYKIKVDEYNKVADQYNNSTTQEDADKFKDQLDKLLPEINKMADDIGVMNQQLADIQAKVNELTEKAKAEAEKTNVESDQQVLDRISSIESELVDKIQEVAGREFGTATSELQFAEYTPTATDVPLRIDIAGLGRTIYEDDRVSINEYGSMFDVKTGDYLGDLTEDQMLQLRQRLGLPTEQGDIIGETPTFGGTTGEPGSMIGPVGEGGDDTELMNTQIKDFLVRQQFYQDQIANTQAEITRLQGLKSELEAGLEQVSPLSRGELESEISNINSEINRLTDIQNKSSDESAKISEELATLEEELATRTATETERTMGRIERQTAAELARYEREQADFERELARLEADLAKAEDEAQRTRVRQEFVTGQRERLSQAGRLTGTLQEQIDAELNDLLDQYESARERATTAATEKTGLVAPQPKRPGGQGITDQEVIDLLGLGEEEAARYGFVGDGEAVTGGEGAGAGAGGEGEGGIAPEEEAPTEEVAPEETAQRFDAQGRPIFATATVRPEGAAPTREAAPAISPRVTGEALVGILGEKEPLFGGDEDQQRAVWNRRSLRLRRALGL